MAAVEHDHMVRVLEVAEERGVPFLAMEFLKGEPLDVRLEREKVLPVLEVVRIGKEIAEGLAAAHEQGLIHRDIKPANIWLEAPKNRVKILDFGLARSADAESGLTQQGAIIGTPAYMAPEQAAGNKVDARSDLFSLGVLLYRLCSGKPAFKGTDTISTLMAVATEQPPPPVQANPELPSELSDLVMQLLAKEPERRPPSARVVVELLQALEQQLLREREPHDKTETLSPTAKKKEVAPTKRSRIPVLVAAALLLAGLIGVGLWAAGVFRVQTEQGDLVFASDDPDFAFVPVKGGGVTLEDRKAKRTYQIKAVPQGKDDYELEVTDAGAELVFKTRTFTVQRGKTVALRAWFERKAAVVVKPPEKGTPGVDDAWVKEVSALPLDKQIAAVVARLKERNPGWTGGMVQHDGQFGPEMVQHDSQFGREVRLWMHRPKDLSPLRALTGVGTLVLRGSLQEVDVSPLRNMTGLKSLHLHVNRLPADLPSPKEMKLPANLSSLKEMKLKYLHISIGEGGSGHWLPPTDLSALKGLPLTGLDLDFGSFSDLSPLKGMKLQRMKCNATAISDLSPLQGMPLVELNMSHCPVSDLSPLQGMPLKNLTCLATKVTDLSPLKDLPLVDLVCDFKPLRDAAVLHPIKTLTTVNGQLAHGVAISAPPGGKVRIASLKTFAGEEITLEAKTFAREEYRTRFGTPHFVLVGHRWDIQAIFESKSFKGVVARPDVSPYPEGFAHFAAVKSADGLRLFVNGKLVRRIDFDKPVSLDAQESFELMAGMAKGIRVSRIARYRADFTPPERFETDADTLALYHCDEGEGELLHDSSGNNHHGILEGNAQWVRGGVDPVVLKPVPDAWIKEVAAEPAEKQLARVLKRLGERNPGFDGKDVGTISDGAVTELSLISPAITDIDPIRALPKLKVVQCGPRVKDLSPLKGLPLKEVSCEFKAERDAAVLRSIKTLEKINGRLAAEFWKEVDAKTPPKKE